MAQLYAVEISADKAVEKIATLSYFTFRELSKLVEEDVLFTIILLPVVE